MQLCTPKTIAALAKLFSDYGLSIELVENGADIPGSHWGECEAGLIKNTLFIRQDTPLHSALHEGCHFICMEEQRRTSLHTDAGGSDAEEDAVCYLQILLAGELSNEINGCTRGTLQADMDSWGYSFRLGSAKAWFEQDADEAHAWLQQREIINSQGVPVKPGQSQARQSD